MQQLAPVQQAAPVQHEPALAASAGMTPARTRMRTASRVPRNLLLISNLLIGIARSAVRRCWVSGSGRRRDAATSSNPQDGSLRQAFSTRWPRSQRTDL